MEFYTVLSDPEVMAKAIKNPDDVVREIDTYVKTSNNVDEQAGSKIKLECLVSATCLLFNIYKSRLNALRIEKLREHAKRGHESKSRPVRERGKPADKIIKSDCVPASMIASSATQIKLAIALFLSTRLSDSMRKSLVAVVANRDDDSNADFLMTLFESQTTMVANIREYIQQQDAESSSVLKKSNERYIICAMIELSDLLKEKIHCKLAMDINCKKYITYVQQYLDVDRIKTIVPFEPAISRYLKLSIALCSQKTELRTVHQHFLQDPKGAIDVVIRGLPSLKEKTISGVSDKGRVFNSDEVYQCHKGPPGYTRDIVATYHKFGPVLYKILTYSDCLYDVIGRTTETVDQNGFVTKIDELFDRIPWDKRLTMLSEFRAKVVITNINGDDLNNYDGESSDITVGWFNDDGLSCSKTFTMRKPKTIKIKSEGEADVEM